MGLKSAKSFNYQQIMINRLKSDQNGIEIRITSSRGHILCIWLKSDQNGIEIFYAADILYESDSLKSDQNGIEISLTSH